MKPALPMNPIFGETKHLTPALSPFCSADGSTGLTTDSAKRGEGETVAASWQIGNVGCTPVQGFNARILSGISPRRVRVCGIHDFLEIPMSRIGRPFSPHYFAAIFPRPVA
jgi:hypothetical protein